MQQLAHYSDVRIVVKDDASGFSATFSLKACDALLAAIAYARVMPPTAAPPARGGATRARATAPSPLRLCLIAALQKGDKTVAQLAGLASVVANIKSTSPTSQRTAVVTVLARLEKDGVVKSKGDAFMFVKGKE